jgi:hypothetical protein
MQSPSTSDIQLSRYCQRFGIPLKGILFKDQLERLRPQAGAYIINMSDADDIHGGTHWIGLWLDPLVAYYFDSFGISPPLAVIEFAHRFGSREMLRSKQEIQNIHSGGCGQYTLLWLYYMTHSAATTRAGAYREYAQLFH